MKSIIIILCIFVVIYVTFRVVFRETISLYKIIHGLKKKCQFKYDFSNPLKYRKY